MSELWSSGWQLSPESRAVSSVMSASWWTGGAVLGRWGLAVSRHDGNSEDQFLLCSIQHTRPPSDMTFVYLGAVVSLDLVHPLA